MNTRYRLPIALALGILAFCACALTTSHRTEIANYARQITGTGELTPAPEAYLTICLPKDWRQDPISQKLIADTARPNFAKLRSAATTKIYVDGEPDFEHRFQSDSNSGPVKTLPAVLVQHDGETSKWSGTNVLRAEVELDTCIKRLHLPCTPKPEPKPEPKPDTPKSDVPDLPDVTPTETPLPEEDNTVGVILSALVGGLVSWLVMFTRKS